MKFCKQCGKQLEDAAKFCSVCGTIVEKSEGLHTQHENVTPPEMRWYVMLRWYCYLDRLQNGRIIMWKYMIF